MIQTKPIEVDVHNADERNFLAIIPIPATEQRYVYTDARCVSS